MAGLEHGSEELLWVEGWGRVLEVELEQVLGNGLVYELVALLPCLVHGMVPELDAKLALV
jgi:hypothetical protein